MCCRESYTGELQRWKVFPTRHGHRHAARNLPCVTIDVVPAKGVGFIAEANKLLARRLLGSGYFRPLKETDFDQPVDYSIAVSVCPTRTTRVISGLSDSAIGNTSRSASWIRFAELAGDYEVLNSSHAEGTTPPRETQGLATTSLTRRLAGTQKVEDGAEAVEKAMIHKLAEMFVVSEGDIEAAQLLARVMASIHWLPPSCAIG